MTAARTARPTVTSPPADLPRLAPRRSDSHKGDFGHALLIAGSRAMPGAPALAAMAALRGGAGLVTVAVPEACHAIVAGFEPSYMAAPLACDGQGHLSREARPVIEQLLERATNIGCGPGLGRSDALDEIVAWLYGTAKQTAVFDADALNALAAHPDQLARHAGPRILTPHPGEFRRLSSLAHDADRRELESRAVEIAGQAGVVIVLKGHHTLITDGRSSYHNTTGNPGMATGGTGDVLTGVITALAGQGLSPFDAARLGVYAHGLSGDLAAAELGETSLIASDLLRFLPQAFQSLVRA